MPDQGDGTIEPESVEAQKPRLRDGLFGRTPFAMTPFDGVHQKFLSKRQRSFERRRLRDK
jgi:hypothetical protein